MLALLASVAIAQHQIEIMPPRCVILAEELIATARQRIINPDQFDRLLVACFEHHKHNAPKWL